MNEGQRNSAIELLEGAAVELAGIHRGSDYSIWRNDTAPRLGRALSQTDPFCDFCNVWIHTGDGGGVATTPRFGEWAIDLLVDKKVPEEILIAFFAEVERNVATYCELSPILGIRLDVPCDLDDGITLAPEPRDTLASLVQNLPFQTMHLPTGTSLLCQSFTVSPAFECRRSEEGAKRGTCFTSPEGISRDEVRKRVRLASLLASDGPVELPLTALRPDHGTLFVADKGNSMGRPFTERPLVSYPVVAAAVARAFELLGKFREIDSLARAIDRLGRARLAISTVDRALELGMAAEITLMHDHSPANTEIAHKIGGRAAWLLGHDAAEREAIFVDMKKLYQARSQAVHSGVLSSKSNIDLDAADRLVARTLSAILERGSFPNWNSLIMGGNGEAAEVGHDRQSRR